MPFYQRFSCTMVSSQRWGRGGSSAGWPRAMRQKGLTDSGMCSTLRMASMRSFRGGYAHPAGAQAHFPGGDEQIHGGGGAILLPVTRLVAGFAADAHAGRRLGEHARIGVIFPEGVQYRPVGDHHKAPGPAVHGGRSQHGALQKRVNFLSSQRLRGVFANGAAVHNGFQHWKNLLAVLLKKA